MLSVRTLRADLSEMQRAMPAEIHELVCDSASAWTEWLAEHHAASPGLWLKMAKKETGIPSVTYKEALSVALCYGWIDGQKAASTTSGYWLQRFTPRRPRSKWSQVNRAAALALIADGKMMPAGLREVEAAQKDGRWEQAYAPQSTATVPDDLTQALDQHPAAKKFFETLKGSNRYAILYRLQEAKKPETRARRLEKFIAMLNEQQSIYPIL